ncbi:MAG TPA: histidine kinase [Terriglobales bacterium]|nr:histidine kinase [Terriglobales bacterium]
MDPRLISVSLLVRMGVAAAVASALVRSKYFKTLLYREDRNTTQAIHLALFIAVPFALGVVVRMSVRNFIAADLALESAVLIGVIAGRGAGVVGGVLVALPSMLQREFLSMPFYAVSGYFAGVLRDLAVNKEDVWSFTPFLDLSIYRWIRRNLDRPRLDWQISFFFYIVLLHFLQLETGRIFHGRLFYIQPTGWLSALGLYAVTVAAVAIPLKIWNNTRIEQKLEEQERLLLQARMEALQSQINPHFLFNTLNSVASLVRFDPEMARVLIVKLANILRRILRRGDSFNQLREELVFIDDYLDIEVVRFGRDKLRVVKDLDPETLDLAMPSMLLQPLVENSIKHGLSPKIEGGSITLRSRLENGALVIQVEDDGIGIVEGAGPAPAGSGIGLANVAERLKVLYGENAKMQVESVNGKGTRVSITLPMVQSVDIDDTTRRVYEERASTRS